MSNHVKNILQECVSYRDENRPLASPVSVRLLLQSLYTNIAAETKIDKEIVPLF